MKARNFDELSDFFYKTENLFSPALLALTSSKTQNLKICRKSLETLYLFSVSILWGDTLATYDIGAIQYPCRAK
jgi:hypothetical protein